MLGKKLAITKVHGQWFDGPNNSKMMPIFHPAYLLRNPSREVGSPKWLMYQDMKEKNNTVKPISDTHAFVRGSEYYGGKTNE